MRPRLSRPRLSLDLAGEAEAERQEEMRLTCSSSAACPLESVKERSGVPKSCRLSGVPSAHLLEEASSEKRRAELLRSGVPNSTLVDEAPSERWAEELLLLARERSAVRRYGPRGWVNCGRQAWAVGPQAPGSSGRNCHSAEPV